jgi:hypothetical protein
VTRIVTIIVLALLSVTVPSAVTIVMAEEPPLWGGYVLSNGEPISSPTLQTGRLYRIVALSYFYYDYALMSRYLAADPQYYTTLNSDGENWRNHVPAPDGHSFLQINGMDVNWGPFSNGDPDWRKSHLYSIYYEGAGEPIKFTIVDWVDQNYSNNVCHLWVRIYEVPRGTIVVTKNTQGGDGTFVFSTTGGDGLPETITLTTVGGTATQTFTGIDPDLTYSISEIVSSGWTLVSSTCTGTFTVPAGGSVTCTFINKKLIAMQTLFSDTNGNPLPTDVDGQSMVQIVAPRDTVRSTNPGAVVAIVDITNPGMTFSSDFQFTDTLPQDWTLLPDWKGKSTGNVKVCFYDASVFPLTGFPFSPNWAFECTGGIDMTNQVSYMGTSSTTVSVKVPGLVLSALDGFGPGDHITVPMKMKLIALKGSSLPTGYFSDGPNSAGVFFRTFADSATAEIGGFTGSSTRAFRGYPKNG